MITSDFIDSKMNTIIHGDCLETMKQVPDKYFELIYIDPPYFEVKGDFDFIWKSFDEYLLWVGALAVEFKRILADNGSLFIWGHAKKIAYTQIIFDKYFNLENSLVWNKIDCQTRMGRSEFRSFAPVTERCLFYSNEVGMTGLEMITEEFIKPRNPFSLYLRDEFKRSGITNKEISTLFPSKTGGLTGCVSNWLNGDNVITEEQYNTVRDFLNGDYLRKEYEYLRKEYEDLRKEYEEKRRYFSNDSFDDVLFFAQDVHITGKYKHPTQKSPSLTAELLRATTRKDSKVYIPFCGSGTEAEQCKSLGIDWVANEIEADYVAIANKRLEAVQGSLF